MKKRILALASILALVGVLVVPAAVLATDGTTGVSGTVVSGYTFTAPTAIDLTSMTPGTAKTDNSAGSLVGNSATGYTVKGLDVKGSNTGKMVNASNDVLANMLKIGPSSGPTNTANTETTFLTTSGPASSSVPFYVSQLAAYSDNVTGGYTITITFTVAAVP